jgi:hypothetical protein
LFAAVSDDVSSFDIYSTPSTLSEVRKTRKKIEKKERILEDKEKRKQMTSDKFNLSNKPDRRSI